MASEAHSRHSEQRDRGKSAVTQLELSRQGPSRLPQTKKLLLWISWKRRGSAEPKVSCSSYQNTACTTTSGLAVSAMGALILAELCKDARLPQWVLNCGAFRAIVSHSRVSGAKMTRRHRSFTLSFGLWFSQTLPLPRKLWSQATLD